MTDDVKLTFVGDAAGAEKAIADLDRRFTNLENKIKRFKSATKPDGRDIFDKMADGAARLGSSLTGVNGPIDLLMLGVRQIGKEWDAVLARQERARTVSLDYASVLENLAINTRGDASFPTLEAVDKEVKRVSKETGVEPKNVAQAMNYAMSAKGDLSGADASKAVQSVLGVIPNLREAQDVMVGAVLDIRKSFPQATSEDVQGFMFQSMQTSRVTETEKFVKNAVPGILGSAKVDESKDLRANSAIYNTLTQFGEDVEGRRSRTAAISLNMQLKEFLKEEPGLDSNLKRVQFMQQNPESRQAFLYGGEFKGRKRSAEMTVTGPDGEEFTVGGKKASFERQSFPAVEQLLTGGSRAAESLKSAYDFTPELQGSGVIYEQMRKELKANQTIQLADMDRKLKNAAVATSLDDVEGAKAGSVRGGLDDIMAANKFSYMSRTFAAGEYNVRTMFGQSPLDAAQASVPKRDTPSSMLWDKAIQHLAMPLPMAGGLGFIPELTKLADMLSGANPENTQASLSGAKSNQQAAARQEKLQQEANETLKEIARKITPVPRRASAVESN